MSDSLRPWNSPGQNTGVGSLSLLQGIFPTQGSNPGLPHCRWIFYQLSHKGSPKILERVAYPFSRGSSWPRNRTSISCIVDGFFISFPDSSVGEESACNTGDPSLIPGLGRSAGEGIGYPLQYSWASLVAQLVKNPPAMGETWVRSLNWEDPLEKGKATHCSILAWRIPGTV